MSLGRYDRVVEACARAEALLDRILPSWGGFFRTTLRLEGAYCAVYLDPRPQTADELLKALEPVDLPGTMRFIARSVRGELELTRGNARTAALIQRMSLRCAGHWSSLLGAGSQWELYILSMCLVTDVPPAPPPTPPPRPPPRPPPPPPAIFFNYTAPTVFYPLPQPLSQHVGVSLRATYRRRCGISG